MEGEDLVLVHVVDVHPDDVAGYLVVAERVGNLLDACVGMIAVAALLVAKRPEGRHLHRASKVHEFLHDFLRRVLLDDDHAEGGSHAAEDDLGIGGHPSLPGVVGNDAEAGAVAAQAEHPGVTLVEVSAFVNAITGRIDVPELDGLAVATQGSPHLAASIEVGIGIHLDADHALSLFRGEDGTELPGRTNRTLRSQFANEDGRRTVRRRIVLSRIEDCDILGCHVALLCRNVEQGAGSKEQENFELIHLVFYLMITFLPPMMFMPR